MKIIPKWGKGIHVELGSVLSGWLEVFSTDVWVVDLFVVDVVTVVVDGNPSKQQALSSWEQKSSFKFSEGQDVELTESQKPFFS